MSQTLQAGPPVLYVDAHRYKGRSGVLTEAGSSVHVRERQGKASFSVLATGAVPIRYAEQQRLLSNQELWAAYRTCGEIRACVDAIVREISTWDWCVESAVDPKDPRYERAMTIAADAQTFLKGPNKDGEPWEVLISKMCRDLLVYDSMAAEHVLDRKGKLVEIVALRGCDVLQDIDQYQRLLGYRQQNAIGGAVYFDPQQILYMNLFPNTTAPGGLPLIESLIYETMTLLNQSRHLMLAMDSDEVPPGILVLAGIAGVAADRAVESIRNMKGQDHKLRVLTTNNPGGLSADWVELRHTPKDLDMLGVVKEVRRTVWRVFGVKPVSMGDTEATPRATAEVQVTAQDSGLISPILEQLQALINARTLPLVVGDPALAALVRFRFNLELKSSAKDMLDDARKDASDFDRGILTVNERRAIRKLAPVEGGDVPLIKSGAGYLRLVDVAIPPEEDEEMEMEEPEEEGEDAEDAEEEDGAGGKPGMKEDGEEDGGGVEDPEAGTSEEEAPADAKPRARKALVARARKARKRVVEPVHAGKPVVLLSARPWSLLSILVGSDHEPTSAYQQRSDLPSDWQPSGKFKGMRTLDLPALGEQITRYGREVAPLYRRARLEVTADVRASLKDGKVTNEELPALLGRVNTALDKLAVDWSDVTQPIYRGVARLGRDAAVHFSGVQVVEDWQQRADTYHVRATNYLVQQKGLIADIRQQVTEVILGMARAKRAVDVDPTAVLEGVDVALILGTIRRIFDSEEYRISNWSGRLVELANEIFQSGMGESMLVAAPDPKTDTSPEWWFEWVSVEDAARCPTCTNQGTKGFRPISQMTVQPGGNTECRGRCRCVVVYWTAEEVKTGKAISLAGEVRSAGGAAHRAGCGCPVHRSDGPPPAMSAT